jgi:hypothetical protein
MLVQEERQRVDFRVKTSARSKYNQYPVCSQAHKDTGLHAPARSGCWQEELAKRVDFFGSLGPRLGPNITTIHQYVCRRTKDTGLHASEKRMLAGRASQRVRFFSSLGPRRNKYSHTQPVCSVGAQKTLVRTHLREADAGRKSVKRVRFFVARSPARSKATIQPQCMLPAGAQKTLVRTRTCEKRMLAEERQKSRFSVARSSLASNITTIQTSMFAGAIKTLVRTAPARSGCWQEERQKSRFFWSLGPRPGSKYNHNTAAFSQAHKRHCRSAPEKWMLVQESVERAERTRPKQAQTQRVAHVLVGFSGIVQDVRSPFAEDCTLASEIAPGVQTDATSGSRVNVIPSSECAGW